MLNYLFSKTLQHKSLTSVIAATSGLIVGLSSLQDLANIATILSALAAIVGIPFLILNLKEQQKLYTQTMESQQNNDIELSFGHRCASITQTLSYVTNIDANIEGGAAILKYGWMCSRRSMSFEQVLNQLGEYSVLAVLTSLLEVTKWTISDQKHFKYYDLFRARYMALLLALEQIIEPAVKDLNDKQIFTKFGSDQQKYQIIKAYKRLQKLDFDAWSEVQLVEAFPED